MELSPLNIDVLFDVPPTLPTDVIDGMPPKTLFEKCLKAARDSECLNALATGSYQHENGFTKLYLGTCGQGRLKVRAHYWPVVSDDITSNVHNHRFAFTSHVIRGELVHTVYREGSAGSEFRHYKYKPRLGSTEYVLEYVGTANLEKISETTLVNGSVYEFASTDLHTSEPVGDNPVITLFVEERSNLTDFCDVYATKYPPQTLTLDSPPLRPFEWTKSLKALILALSDNEG